MSPWSLRVFAVANYGSLGHSLMIRMGKMNWYMPRWLNRGSSPTSASKEPNSSSNATSAQQHWNRNHGQSHRRSGSCG
jgi:hypothetical protein